jgi:hypothetical protein
MRGSAGLRYLTLAAAFAAGIAIARFSWVHIKLPFSNPWHIIGAPSVLRFNPDTNRVGYLCMVSIPSLLLLALYLTPVRRLKALLFPEEHSPTAEPKKAPKRVQQTTSAPRSWLGLGLKLGLVLLLMVVSIAMPNDYTALPFDTFHEGESLGPATNYLHGGVPYKDFYVLHGFIQDCGKAALAFKLFGRSIAAVRTLWSIVKVVVYGLIGILLLMLFEGEVLWAISAVLLFVLANTCMMPIYEEMLQTVSKINNRDITTVLFLIAMFALHRRLARDPNSSPRGLAMMSFFPAFVAVASLGFSVDRGTLLTLSYLVLCVILYAGLVRSTAPRQRAAYVAGSLAGVLAGLLALGALVRWNFVGFFGFTYGILPRLFAMMDTLAFPIFRPPWFAVVALVAFNTYWILLKFLQTPRAGGSLGDFCRGYFQETTLLVVSLTLFTGALGISDWDHVSVNALAAYILFLTIVFKHVLPRLLIGNVRKTYACAVGVLAICTFVWAINCVFSQPLIASNFPLGKPDYEFVRRGDAEAVAFLEANLGPGENFFTMTSEGSWYYLLDKPCPTRFVLIYAAGSDFYQNETVHDLETRNVKYVIYHNDYFSNDILGIPTLVRLPMVTQYLQTHYVPCVCIGGNAILVRKGRQEGG